MVVSYNYDKQYELYNIIMQCVSKRIAASTYSRHSVDSKNGTSKFLFVLSQLDIHTFQIDN